MSQHGRRTPTTPSPKPSPLASPESSLILEGKARTPERGRTRPSTPVREEHGTSEQTLDDTSNESIGLAIERPRSALHSGDFRSDSSSSSRSGDQTASTSVLTASPPAPWAFGGTHLRRNRHEQQSTSTPTTAVRPSRTRASSSLLSNVILKPSTSPLSQSQWNDSDSDNQLYDRQIPDPSPSREQRRHTFSPRSFEAFQARCFNESPPSARSIPGLRREGTYPFQAVQPRRFASASSGTHTSGQWPASYSSQSPLSRSRGNSLSQASMVGSFEESILRGRMSSTPSRPLDFIAQIGVLGRGKCKSTLKCPPHVSVPFPAVFYSYNPGNGRISDDQPCPYVGLVDLEHHLKPAEETASTRRPRRRHSPMPPSEDKTASPGRSCSPRPDQTDSKYSKVKKDNLRRRSRSPPRKAPPGGCYRIPQQGQLQVILKNPNKTAVKLFLIPYDLSDMEPGTKTFIRQRSYSAGPIIDMPLSSRKNLGTDRPEASLSTSEDPADRPVLRYLIHLHICCPSKGRYYLYKSIRVVFANRVPDGKEKLRNEVQLPEPKYSTYKPERELLPGSMGTGQSPFSPISQQAMADRVARRRSTQTSFASQLRMQGAFTANCLPSHNQPGNFARSMEAADGFEDNTRSDFEHQSHASLPTRDYLSEPRRSRSPFGAQPDAVRSSPIRPIPFILSPIQSSFFSAAHLTRSPIEDDRDLNGSALDGSPSDAADDRRDASSAFLHMSGRQASGLLSKGFKDSGRKKEAERDEWEML